MRKKDRQTEREREREGEKVIEKEREREAVIVARYEKFVRAFAIFISPVISVFCFFFLISCAKKNHYRGEIEIRSRVLS